MVRTNQRSPRRPLALSLAALGVLILAGCGDDGGDASSGGDQSATSAPAAVCNGDANDAAPDVTPGSSPVAIYEDAGDGWQFRSWVGDLDEARDPLVPEDAALVVCLEVTSSEVVDTCEFEEDGSSFELELADAEYEVAVRAAATGEELAGGTASATAGDCPMFTSFTQGEASRVDYARPVDDVVALIDEAEAAA